MPEPSVNTTYAGGGLRTVTQGAPLAGGSGLDINALMRLLAQRRKPVAPPLGLKMAAVARPALSQAQDSNVEANAGRSAIDNQLDYAKKRAELLQLQALEQGPVKKYTHGGPGMIGGYTLDPLNMNAYQRKAYLPSESRGDESRQDTMRRAADLQEAAEERRDKRQDEREEKFGAERGYREQEARRRAHGAY